MTLQERFLLFAGIALTVTLAVAVLALRWTVVVGASDDLEERLSSALGPGAAFLEEASSGNLATDALRLADLVGFRVTIIGVEGSVLGESAISVDNPGFLANHANRPEVRDALEGEIGRAHRASATLGREMFYVATRLERPDGPVVLRLSAPADPLSNVLQQALWLLALAGALGAGLLWLGGRMIEGSVALRVTELTGYAREMSQGIFGPRPTPAEFPRDLTDLAGALGLLGEQMKGRLQELESQRNDMQGLIDSIAEGVIALTDDARVLRMNPAAAEHLDIRNPGRFAPIGTLIRHPELRDYLEESVITPHAPREFTLGDRHLLVSSYPMANHGAVVTMLDVTELHRMEQVRRDFVANASHELKTPLTSIRGFAETLIDDEPPPDIKSEFLESIRKNTVRLQRLVDDLLDLSRLESGHWTASEEEVDVRESACETWEALRAEHTGRAVDFSVRGDAIALADGQALHQILENLLANALRYTPDGGQIEIGIEARGPVARVSVSDTGTGIPSSALPRIFERFYRVDSGRDRVAGGTGLGLAIARHLVQSMGGEISAESRLGHGTTIHFTLPLVEARGPDVHAGGSAR